MWISNIEHINKLGRWFLDHSELFIEPNKNDYINMRFFNISKIKV